MAPARPAAPSRQHDPPVQLPLLVLWGRYDPSFQVEEAQVYRRDVPAADVHILDVGDFALDEQPDAIAMMRRWPAAAPRHDGYDGVLLLVSAAAGVIAWNGGHHAAASMPAGGCAPALQDLVAERPSANGMVPCGTFENATLLCPVEQNGGVDFPLTLEMKRIWEASPRSPP